MRTLSTFLLPLLFCTFAHGQFDADVRLARKLLSFRDARLNIGLGAELGLYLENTEKGTDYTVYHTYTGSPESVQFDDADAFPLLGANLALDLFSPNSIIGFYTELSYFNWQFGVLVDDEPTDTYNINLLEVPLYLKINTGSLESQHHLLLLLGGSYSIPLSINHTVGATEFKDIGQMQSFLGLGGAIGYEFYAGKIFGTDLDELYDQTRIIVFSRLNYRLQSPFNLDSAAPVFTGVENSEVQYNDLLVSFGVKFFFRMTNL